MTTHKANRLPILNTPDFWVTMQCRLV